MQRIFLAFATFALLIIGSNALYRHQAGKFDWNLKTIGDIDRLRFIGQHTAFITTDGFIGLFRNADGQIEWSRDLQTPALFAEFGNNGFLTFDPQSRVLSVSDFKNGLRSNFFVFEGISSQEEIKNVAFGSSQNGIQTAVLTDKNLYIFTDDKITSKSPAKFDIVRYSAAQKTFLGISVSEKEYCVSAVEQKTKTCYQTENQPSVINVNEIVINLPNKIRVVPFSTLKEAQFNSSKTTYLSECSTLIVGTAKGSEVHSLNEKQGTWNKVTVLDTPFDETAFACKQESTGNFLLTFQVTGDSTIKAKSWSLASPSTPARILFDKIVDFRVGRIQEIYVDRLSDDFRFIYKTENLQIGLIRESNKVSWRREDSISQIKEVQFFDYESLEDKEINPYFEHLDEHQDRLADIPANFMRRITSQSERFVRWVRQLIELGSAMTGINFNLKQLLEVDSKFERQNGLQKIIIAVTERNSVLGLDSKTGKTFWERSFDRPWRIEQLFKSKIHHSVKEGIIYLKEQKTNKAKLIHFNPLDGLISSTEEFDKAPQTIIPVQLAKTGAFIVAFNENDVRLYPEHLDKNAFSEHFKDLSIYKIQKSEIIGYKLIGKSLIPTWNFNLPKDEEIIANSQWSYDIDETSFKTIIPEDNKVIYKFSDSNNFALLTKSNRDKPHLNLYIINGVTGRILSAKSQFDVDLEQPVNLLYDENTIFVSYFNTNNLNYEIWVTELYKSQLESSFQHLLHRYFFEDIKVDEEEKYHKANPGLVIFSQKYHFAPGIKSFGVVETIHGISRKNLIIVTSNEQVYSLDRGLLSTRRQISIDGKPLESSANSFGSTELPPYQPILPINPQKYLTYYQKFTGLRHAEASPTRFESTSLVFIYGHDVVYVRTAPEKEFDMLSSDFKYEILLGSIALIAVGLVVVKRLSRKHKLYKLFLGS